MNIILVGMPYSGKSTIGKKLSSLIKYNFLDTDEWIQKEEGSNITEIFQRNGELYFRELEGNLIREFGSFEKYVVSTGGGTPAYENNMDVLNKAGVTIFIDAPIEELIQRAQGDNSRPLLEGNAEKKVRHLFSIRVPIYKKAQYVIQTDGKKIDDICEEIIKNVFAEQK